MGQRLTINPVTRIEGHAKILLDLDDQGEVSRGHLQVLELRGFEKLLEKMELFKMPQVTGRICGVCPAAHHLVSVIAIENGLGVTVPRDAGLLRELLYLGHILHSHALSNFVLAGPDIFLADQPAADRNVFGLVKHDAAMATQVLRLRTIGQRVVEIVGGRGVHPVIAVPGGMAARPSGEELAMMAGWGQEALAILEELAPRLQEGLDRLKDIRAAMMMPFRPLAISRNGSLSYLEGDVTVGDPDGTPHLSFAAADYADHLAEHRIVDSYMKSIRLRDIPGEDRYFVGPLARLILNGTIPTPRANGLLQVFRSTNQPRRSAVDFIEARYIEMVYCAERMHAIAAGEWSGGPLRVPATPRAGRFVGLIEAPRGILVHDYSADEKGRVTAANLIVATQNNYDAIDDAITASARQLLKTVDEQTLLDRLEFALRCFDPCLACATHLLGRMPMSVEIRMPGGNRRTITRRCRA